MTLTATKVFEEWRGKSLEDALLECRDQVESPDFETVQRWRDAGGKVTGHFQVYFPEEIVHAAGMLPFKVRGAPVEPNKADSHFGSYLCSILKSSLELALSDIVELDMFVSHPICDAARNLAAIWGRNYDYPCQILYLPQNPNSAGSVEYLRNEYDRMRRLTQEVAGREITDDDREPEAAPATQRAPRSPAERRSGRRGPYGRVRDGGSPGHPGECCSPPRSASRHPRNG